MKTSKLFSTVTFCAIAITATGWLVACENKTQENAADATKQAEEQNEVKFENKKLENDAQFLVDAAAFNLEEVQLGRVAEQRSNNADVKALAKMMVTEHEKALKEVQDLAKNKQISVPDSIGSDAQEAYDMITSKTGDEFNKAYCERLIENHKEMIAGFEKISADSRDQDIKGWTADKLPGLRKHVDHIFECQKKLGVK